MSEQFDFFLSAPTVMIQDAIPRTERALIQHEVIVCNISGGADSDIMLDMVWRLDHTKKVRYVFFDTGLEMAATKRQIEFLQNKYDIEIETVRPEYPVPYVVRKHGYPFISKVFSEFIYRLQKHNFKWEDRPYDELLAEYPTCKSALQWWCNTKREGEHAFLQTEIGSRPYLKEFMIQNPPPIPISPKCCDFSKKKPAAKVSKNADLTLVGIRKLEGGARSTVYKSCFIDGKHGKKHFPTFWFDNDDKRAYSQTYGVTHSDAYTVYGCKRTGCAGCPFTANFKKEVEMLELYEPKLAAAVKVVFGPAYEYTDAYHKFRDEQREKEKRN